MPEPRTVDEIPWEVEPPPASVALTAARRCRHPRQERVQVSHDGSGAPETRCGRCGHVVSAEAARRGRNNRKRGNGLELWVARQLQITKVGQMGGPEDAGQSHEPLVGQVKSGAAFPPGLWARLQALPERDGPRYLIRVSASLSRRLRTIPLRGDQLRFWAVVSTPGAGRPRQAILTFEAVPFMAFVGEPVVVANANAVVSIDLAEWVRWYVPSHGILPVRGGASTRGGP